MGLGFKLALAGCLSAAGVAVAVPAAQAAFPGANGRVAFAAAATRGDVVPPSMSRSLDVALPDGRGRRSLRGCVQVEGQPDRGDCSIEYRSPAWSPSGARLAFDAGARLALIRGDGTGFRLLAQRTADDGEPAWSPGGTRLVFSGARGVGGRSDLYIVDVRNGRLRRLTFRGGRSPAWSTRGRIAFVRAGDIYTVRADGTGLRRITFHRGSDPAWSPHGSKLAFARQRRFGPFSLYLVRSNGRGLRRLATGGADSPEQPSWAPDGKWIAYESFDSGIWAQRLDGRGVRQVASGAVGAEYAVSASSPDWQPLH